MRIRELRKARGLTQIDLAELCGREQATISNVETGRGGTLETLRRIAEALEVEVVDLFSPSPRAAQIRELVEQINRLAPEDQAMLVSMIARLTETPSRN